MQIEEQKERMAIAEKEEGRQLAIAKSEAAAVRSELERLEGDTFKRMADTGPQHILLYD